MANGSGATESDELRGARDDLTKSQGELATSRADLSEANDRVIELARTFPR